MSNLQINLNLTAGARKQLANSTESICLTQNNSSSQPSDPLPVWCSFYSGCPVGINPINSIKWTESWCVDYSTQVFNSDGTLIQGAGDLSSDQLGQMSAFKDVLTLDATATWSSAPNSGKYNMQCNNDHKTPVSFIYYLKTSVNVGSADSGSNNPVYTSAALVENTGTENVTLIQSINICYRGANVDTDAVISSSGSQSWTTLALNTVSTTDITADYTTNGGWSFYLGGPSSFQLGESTDIVTSLVQSTSDVDGIITGTIGVKAAIGVAVATFILGSINLNVTGQNQAGTSFTFNYNGQATWATIHGYIGKTISFLTKKSQLARIHKNAAKGGRRNGGGSKYHDEDRKRYDDDDDRRRREDDERRRRDEDDNRRRRDEEDRRRRNDDR